MLSKRNLPVRIAKIISSAALLPVVAFAQTPEFITITFDSASIGVPVGAWLPAILASAIGVTAFVWRKKLSRAANTLAIVAAGALAIGAATQMTDAVAGPRPAITLVTSPSLTPIDGAATWLVNNNAGVPIRLTGVSENSVCYEIDTVNTTCTVGLTMSAGATCQVALRNATACQ